MLMLNGVTVETDARVMRVHLPLPPSSNQRQTVSYRPMQTKRGPRHFIIHTPQVKSFYENALILRALLMKTGHKPIADYADFHVQYYLQNMRYDTHNGFKCLGDILEKGGAVQDDKYILFQTARPQDAQGHPGVGVTFPYNK